MTKPVLSYQHPQLDVQPPRSPLGIACGSILCAAVPFAAYALQSSPGFLLGGPISALIGLCLGFLAMVRHYQQSPRQLYPLSGPLGGLGVILNFLWFLFFCWLWFIRGIGR